MQTAPHVTGHLTAHAADDAYQTLAGYEATGGYQAARRVLAEWTPDEIIAEVTASGLRGRGAAGLVTGQKWGGMPRDAARPSYLVCNAAESEPGSFKDRLLLERTPHQLLEGILIAARAIGAEKTFLYIRGEYAEAARTMTGAIQEARDRGFLGADALGSGLAHDVVLVRGAGGYVCGEETALLESIEGKKGQPRRKAAHPAQQRAFGRPALVNNVETLCHLPHIAGRGSEWFRSIGTTQSSGTTLFSVSGQVARPGLFELPLGTPLGEIIFEHAGGIREGHKVKGVLPGGVSMPILPAGDLDVPMASEFLEDKGSGLGTGGIIVMDERTCMVRTACVISDFFRMESCGQCTQCREGTSWISKLVHRIERGAGESGDLAILKDVCSMMEGQTLCAFADLAARPVLGLLRHFYCDFESHVREGRCSFEAGFPL